ncbi:MAG TPA: cytochrome c oxidase subunit 3 [Rhizomicrobium sp.]|nr:cytochrome c oxidase subunit 3 [Rhizomicrobium sp.]
MSAPAIPAARYPSGQAAASEQATAHGGPAARRIVVGYGFWLFILSDIVMFSVFFATYVVLLVGTANGPTPAALFDLRNTALETALLLLSSFCCGLASMAVERRNQLWTQITLAVTGLLGMGFILLEAREFAHMAAEGATPQRSAFLSAFFTLVGCHGLHVSLGLVWLATTMAQFLAKGFRQSMRNRFYCFSLFWHALDIIWIGIFTIVYLGGTMA